MIKFSTDSWHFKLANFGKDRVMDFQVTDICSYSRAVLCGVMNIILLVFVALFFLSFIAVAIYENYTYVMFGTGGPAAVVFDGAVLFIAFIALWEVIKFKMRTRRYDNIYNKLVLNKPDNFIVSVYKKFKDKTCYKVTFDENRSR